MTDVHKAKRIGRDPFIWHLREEHKEAVLAGLEHIYGSTNDSLSFESRIYEIAAGIAEDFYEEAVDEVIDAAANSFLEDLDGDVVSVRFREMLVQSVSYIVLKRCGCDMTEVADDFTFDYIHEFNTLRTLSVLGSSTSELCEPMLVQIGRTIARYNREAARKQIPSRQQKLLVNASDYESKYKGELKPGETLDTLYERFNIHRTDNFTGHSLSVSDVIVLESDGKKTPFYVDSFGFQKLENFFEERFVRTEAEKKIISDFREKTQKYFRPVDGRKAEEIENNVREYLHKNVREQDLPIQFGEVLLYGSRSRGTEKQTSDLDVLVEYEGISREDDLFNLFHEDDFCIGGCKVDINPIKEEKTGSLAVFLQQAAYFMESELAFSIADRYIYIQDATEGYDYTIYDSDFTELDGGVYDDPENSIYEALERSHYVPPEVTYTIAECGEFHGMGRYRDDIKDVQEAIALWKEFQDSPLNGIPSIGILVHTPGQTDLEDEQLDLLSGQKIDLDMMQYYPVICKEEAAIEKICELIENLPEVGIIGKVPERILTELILRELDPGKSLFSEEEKSLIWEYGLQMKDERKTRELVKKLCSRDKIGNQDVVVVIQEARDKIEEKRLTPNTTPYIL